MKLKCELIQPDKPTVNKRIYPKEILEKAMEEFNRKPEQLRLGELDPIHDEIDKQLNTEINLSKVSHKIEKSYLQDDLIHCDIQPLDTPAGRILKQLDEKKINIRPRIIGNVSEDGVVENVYIISFDVVQK